MALRDVRWSYCRHCHRDEETTGDGLLIAHDSYDGTPCAGSDTLPTEPPPEGTVSALTISGRPRRSVAQPPRTAVAVAARSWPWGRRRVIP